MSLLDNLLATQQFTQEAPTEYSLDTLLGGLAPLIAGAPAVQTRQTLPGFTAASRPFAPSYSPRPPNPLAGLNRGLTPAFVGMLTRRRQQREASQFPDYFKAKGTM